MASYTLTVHPDGSIEQKEKPTRPEVDGDLAQLNFMQGEVGGFIELVYHRDEEISCFVNEEGKLVGLSRNPLATAFFGEGGLFPNDYIAGPLLIMGGADRYGNTLGMSERKAREVRVVLSGLTTPHSA